MAANESKAKRIQSPCVGLCSTTVGDRVCRGCQRTEDEIRDWFVLDAEARAAAHAGIGCAACAGRLAFPACRRSGMPGGATDTSPNSLSQRAASVVTRHRTAARGAYAYAGFESLWTATPRKRRLPCARCLVRGAAGSVDARGTSTPDDSAYRAFRLTSMTAHLIEESHVH